MSKKSIVIRILIFLAWIGLLALLCIKARSEELNYIPGYATAYHLKGITASGEYVSEGICASCKDRLGCTIELYQRLPNGSVGNLIGTYICKDTGGSDGIKKGKVIDVWRPNMEECQKFMDSVYADGCKGKVYILIKDTNTEVE